MSSFGRSNNGFGKPVSSDPTPARPPVIYPDAEKEIGPDIPNQSQIPESLYRTKSMNLSTSLNAYKEKAFEKLIVQMDLSAASKMPMDDLKREVERFLMVFTEEMSAQINYREQNAIAQEIVYDMIGLGPLENLVGDPTISDILVNGPKSVFVERFGRLQKTDVEFRSDRHLLQIAQRIAGQVGRRVDESSPMVDARLKDGSRVNVIIPPLSLDGVSISIRKFSKKSLTLDSMAASGCLSEQMADFLKIAGSARLNIIVSGGTGAGKTTLLNGLSQLIDPSERIITIEDSAELQLMQPHVVRLESRSANIEGEGKINITDLVRNSLRMRPDRIVIGECRGGETFDMLQAMNTGHDGSLATVHANNAVEALNRLENLVLMAGYDLPVTVIRNYIAGAIDLIVHISRMRDGGRRITQILQLKGIQDGRIQYGDIFKFRYDHQDQTGRIHGQYVCHEPNPACLEKVRYFGLEDALLRCLSASTGTI